MAITLNHTIVPCFNKAESVTFYCRLFGFELFTNPGKLDLLCYTAKFHAPK